MTDSPICCAGGQVIEDEEPTSEKSEIEIEEPDFEFNLVGNSSEIQEVKAKENENPQKVEIEDQNDDKKTVETETKSDEKNEKKSSTDKSPDSVSTDSGISGTDSGISSGTSEPEADNPELLYDKPKHLNQ